MILKSGFDKRVDQRFHADALVELGTSLDAQITPHVLALESETLTLSGTVDEQYKELRTALAHAYRRDLGLPDVGESAVPADVAQPNLGPVELPVPSAAPEASPPAAH